MTYPVFASGDVLNASDMNAVGLWKVATATFTGTSSTIAIDNCFTTNYTNYRIMVDNMTATAAVINLKLRSSGTPNSANYYQGGWLVSYAGSTSVVNRNNSTDGIYVIYPNGTSYPTGLQLDIKSPQKTERTVFGGNSTFWDGALTIGGYHDNSNSFDGFQLSSVYNLSGTITVYGYNK
jgi:hypothetical protein